MTAEEIEIIVTAKIEEALREFEKIVPAIKEKMQQVQKSFSKVNTNVMTNKLSQAINFMKKKMQDFKMSSENNQVSIKINNKEAQKQISQIQKQIDSLHEKINSRQMKLNLIDPQIHRIVEDTRKSVTPEGINPNDTAMDTIVNNFLLSNKDFTSLNNQAQKLYSEIEIFNSQLAESKNRMAQLKQETDGTATTQTKLGSFFSAFKTKVGQTSSGAGKIGTAFKNIGSNIAGCLSPINLIKKESGSIENVVKSISTKTKGFGKEIKTGIGTVLKYAGALFSLRSIYNTLSSCAQSWLSSQNAEAKQLSTNIEYMKYAMGSTLAPVIQFVINLVYQLMKAIQSVAYALTGVNIFAKASASSYTSMASSAKNAKNETKQLAGVHNEINNIQSNNGSNGSGGDSTAPSFDLSGIDDTPNTIIDAIKSGNWYEVGATIGNKINEAMNSIPWDKIQNTARNLGTDIAKLLNGSIENTDWTQVGNTAAQGLNTAIYFAQAFVHNFNWSGVGSAVANTINVFFKNTDWGALGDTISTGIKGAFDGVKTFFKDFDWSAIVDGLMDFIRNFDWNGVADSMFQALGSACGNFVKLGYIIGQQIREGFSNISQYFQDKVEECGGDVLGGVLKGIVDALAGIGQWIYDHIFKPFIDGFKDVFGIHSPSTIMEEQGNFIIEGLKNGLTGIWKKVSGIFENFGENVKNKFHEIKNNISDTWENVKSKTKEKWEEIKENATDTWENIKGKAREKFDAIKTKVTDTWNNIKNDPNKSGMATAISDTFSNVKEKAKEKFDDIKTKITDSWNNIKNDQNLSSMSDTIKNIFSNLSSDSSNWGKDLVSNMASGIKNNIHKVISAVNSVAEKIKSFLHFSEPDEGPLSNFHTYMPDMINLMSRGIKDNVGKLKSEIENLAGTMSYTINTEAINSIPFTDQNIKPISIQSNSMIDMLEDTLSNYEENSKPISLNLTVNVSNRKLGQILLEDLRDRKRRTGKDIEVLVGG